MINITRLPNNIRIITDPSPMAQTVSLGVWVSVGARYETPEINGISHVLEHMAFKGTETRSAFEISKEIEDVGGIINAYTGKNMTAYFVKILKKDISLGLDIIADIIQNSVMDPQELEKEKGVIIQEINMQNDTPDDLVFDYFAETAFPNQALGRAILGTPQTVRGISSEMLLEYMHSQYTTDRLIISASGAFDEKDFIDSCAKLFTKVTSVPQKGAPSAYYVGGEKRVNKPHEQVNLVLGFEGASYTDPTYYDYVLLGTILGGGMSSRLFQEIREKRGLVYSIYSYNAPESDTGVFSIYAGTGEKEVIELLPVLCDELCKASDQITEEEIIRAKNQIKARLLMRYENMSAHAEMNAIDMIIYGRIIPIEETISRIDSVSLSGLKAAAKNILSSKPTLAALGPIQHVMSYEDIQKRLSL